MQSECGGAQRRVSNLSGLLLMCDNALDIEDENVDPIFDLDASMKSDVNNLAENFYEDCVHTLKGMTGTLCLLPAHTASGSWRH